jgi:hypothetical protein
MTYTYAGVLHSLASRVLFLQVLPHYSSKFSHTPPLRRRHSPVTTTSGLIHSTRLRFRAPKTVVSTHRHPSTPCRLLSARILNHLDPDPRLVAAFNLSHLPTVFVLIADLALEGVRPSIVVCPPFPVSATLERL